jgi:hypothetical protein
VKEGGECGGEERGGGRQRGGEEAGELGGRREHRVVEDSRWRGSQQMRGREDLGGKRRAAASYEEVFPLTPVTPAVDRREEERAPAAASTLASLDFRAQAGEPRPPHLGRRAPAAAPRRASPGHCALTGELLPPRAPRTPTPPCVAVQSWRAR